MQSIDVNTMKKTPSRNSRPKRKFSGGLDPARQWYLYEKIGPFFSNIEARNNACPEPTVPKPKSVHKESPKKTWGRKRKANLLN